MSLLYRAIWQDNRTDLVEKTAQSFLTWVQRRHGFSVDLDTKELQSFETSGVAKDGTDIELSISAVTDDEVLGAHLGALQASIRLNSQDENVTITLWVIVNDQAQWLWVDVQRENFQIWNRPLSAAPSLVRRLLNDGVTGRGDPRWGAVRLEPRPVVADPKRLKESCINLLLAANRTLPIVVVGHDYGLKPKGTIEAAGVLVNHLCGIAQVIVVPDIAIDDFNDLIHPASGVFPGEVRVYLPDPVADDPDWVFENGTLRRDAIGVGQQISALLTPVVAARKPPAEYEVIRPLLRKHTGLSSVQAIEELEVLVTQKDNTIRNLNLELVKTNEEKLAALEEVELLQKQLGKLQDSVVSQLLAPDTPAEVVMGIPDCVDDAITMARRYLTSLAIPEAAAVEIEKLDRVVESRSWASTIWNGLLALNAYANEAKAFEGTFYEWCKTSGHRLAWSWSSKKLAMSESESVMSHDRLRRFRMLPVERLVAVEGKILMVAHLKISSGSLAPRVYFHDDTGGPTKKIHIGFIGPHEAMPTKRSVSG